MALSLGIKTNSKFRIGGDMMTVLDIGPGQRATIEVLGKKMVITDQQRTEVLPSVFVSFGPERGSQGMSSNRFAFEAPHHISIQRV